MIKIRVDFSDRSLITEFNGSYDDAIEYYIGKVFNIGGIEGVNRVCTNVEKLSE